MRPFQTVCAGIERLPRRTQEARTVLRDFLQEARTHHRAHCMRLYRRFARFRGRPGDKWPEAIDRLLLLKKEQALTVLERYTEWVNREPKLRMLGSGRAGFLSLTQYARQRGFITWEVRTRAHERGERAWKNSCPKLRELFQGWLRLSKLRDCAPSTLRRQKDLVICLGQHLRRRRVLCTEMDWDDAVSWIEGMKAAGLKTSTINVRLLEARRFFQWLENQNHIRKSPFADIRPIRHARLLPQVLHEREVLRLLRQTRNPRSRAMLEVLYASGCRVGELLALNISEVSFQGRTAKVMGKGPKERILYLNRAAIRAIKAYLPTRQRILEQWKMTQEPALFVSQRGTRLRVTIVQTMVSKAARDAGIHKRVTPHVLRHSFATHMLDHEADLFSLMRFMGHKSLESTQIYLQVATARLGEVYRRCHPRA